MGACAKGCNIQLQEGSGTNQYGSGRAGGAPLEIAEVRAAATERPAWALLTLDIRNAFGQVQWTDALNATAARVPRFAVPLAMMWRGGAGIPVYAETPEGPWAEFRVYAGVVQGSQEGSPVFCVVIATVLDAVLRDPALRGNRNHHGLYIDAWVMQVP